jgi:hypothetical protein
MQTLGVASTPQPTDGLFKRLFWPTIENQYDVDLVGQQGFWICFIIAVISTVMLIATGQLLIGLLVGITYFLAGLGVRERSIAAAVLIFACYFLDRLSSVELMILGSAGVGNPFVVSVATLLLFSNVRATILSRKWWAPETPADIGELPEQTNTTFFDKVANSMPPAVWPKGRFVFYPLAGLLLLMTVLGMVSLPFMQRKHPVVQKPPSATYDVSPSP